MPGTTGLTGRRAFFPLPQTLDLFTTPLPLGMTCWYPAPVGVGGYRLAWSINMLGDPGEAVTPWNFSKQNPNNMSISFPQASIVDFRALSAASSANSWTAGRTGGIEPMAGGASQTVGGYSLFDNNTTVLRININGNASLTNAGALNGVGTGGPMPQFSRNTLLRVKASTTNHRLARSYGITASSTATLDTEGSVWYRCNGTVGYQSGATSPDQDYWIVPVSHLTGTWRTEQNGTGYMAVEFPAQFRWDNVNVGGTVLKAYAGPDEMNRLMIAHSVPISGVMTNTNNNQPVPAGVTTHPNSPSGGVGFFSTRGNVNDHNGVFFGQGTPGGVGPYDGGLISSSNIYTGDQWTTDGGAGFWRVWHTQVYGTAGPAGIGANSIFNNYNGRWGWYTNFNGSGCRYENLP